MQCSTCHIPMKIENEAKENGFWFLWYRCNECNESYLHKSPFPSKVEEPAESKAEDPIPQK